MKVPFGPPTNPPAQSQVPSGPKPSETDLLMAAATMHDMGRLFEKPEPKPEADEK